MENTKQKHTSSKLKIYQVIQKNFATLGICPNLTMQPYPINGKIFIGFQILISGIYFLLMYIFNDAQTFIEYTQTIYICSCATLMSIAFIIILINVEKLFNLINNCEKVINTRMCSHFIEIIENIFSLIL